jgi:hypothetical protein
MEKGTALLRLERGKDSEQANVKVIEGSSYRAAIQSSFEVR